MAKFRMSRKPQKQHQTRSGDHSLFKNKAHVLELIKYIIIWFIAEWVISPDCTASPELSILSPAKSHFNPCLYRQAH